MIRLTARAPRRRFLFTCLLGQLTLIGLTSLVASGARAAGPIGQVVAACDGVSGWALDPDAPDAPIDVHLYFDGPAGDPGAVGLALRADQHPPGCRGQACGHSFYAPLPRSRLDALAHPVHAYGIDGGGDPNLELDASPASYTCPPPPITAGQRRHILNPATLDAWRLSVFFDLLKVTDLALAAAPVGPVIDGPPAFVVAEGDPQIWLIDQGFRRPVDPATLANWRFTPDLAAPIAAAELDQLPLGTALWPRPLLVQGSGAAVFLIDDRQCLFGDPDPSCPLMEDPETTTGDTGDTTDSDTTDSDTTDSDTASAGGSTAGADTADTTDTATMAATTSAQDEHAGCGCRARSSPHPWALLLLLLCARRRRRPPISP